MAVLTRGPWIDSIQRITQKIDRSRLQAPSIETASHSLKFPVRRPFDASFQAARNEVTGSWREVFQAGQMEERKTMIRQIPAIAATWVNVGTRGIESTM